MPKKIIHKSVGEGASGGLSKVGAQVGLPPPHFWADQVLQFPYLPIFCSYVLVLFGRFHLFKIISGKSIPSGPIHTNEISFSIKRKSVYVN